MTEIFNPTEYAVKMVRTLDLNEAVDFLKGKFPVRKIDEVIKEAVKKKALMANISQEDMEEALRERLGPENAVNVENWLNPGAVDSIERDSAIRIAFALQLDVDETEMFLRRCWYSGFYMRDVKDVIYRHGLEEGWDFKKTQDLADTFEFLDRTNPDPVAENGSQRDDLTQYLQTKYENARLNEEQLKEFITQNEQFFGSFRRRAYDRFKNLYDDLKKEWNTDLDENEKSLSAAEICSLIVKSIPGMRKKGQNTMLRRLIADHMPTRSAMSEILNKYERGGKITQVDRKLLMLSWLASDDGEVLEFNKGQEEDAFSDHMDMINDLMEDCGMPILDPRHPFDWIVMNALYCSYFSNYKNTDADERMQDLIERLAE